LQNLYILFAKNIFFEVIYILFRNFKKGDKIQHNFRIYKNLNVRSLRFYLSKIKDIKKLDPQILGELSKYPTKYNKTITLTKEEEEIIKKYGKTTNTLLNYIIYTAKIEIIHNLPEEEESSLKNLFGL